MVCGYIVVVRRGWVGLGRCMWLGLVPWALPEAFRGMWEPHMELGTEQEKVKTRAHTLYFGVNRVLRQRL